MNNRWHDFSFLKFNEIKENTFWQAVLNLIIKHLFICNLIIPNSVVVMNINTERFVRDSKQFLHNCLRPFYTKIISEIMLDESTLKLIIYT